MQQNIIKSSWRRVKIRVSGVLKANPWAVSGRQALVKNDKQLTAWEDEGGKMPPSEPAKRNN